MRVENIQFNNYNNYQAAPRLKAQNPIACDNTRQLDTSIYSQKGAQVSFGLWVKGANKLEEECIQMFRKTWEGRKGRKYTEQHIQSFMENLKVGHDKHDPRELISAIFDTFKDGSEFTPNLRPEADSVNAILKLTKGMDENDYFDILSFASHELAVGAPKPVVSLANLSEKDREVVLPLVQRVNRFDYSFHDSDVAEQRVGELYENVRCLIYATEDKAKLSPKEKLDYLAATWGDLKRFEQIGGEFKEKSEHSRFVDVAKDVNEAMHELFLK